MNEPPHSQIGALRGELERVPDRRLAELLARLVDHWEALGPVERRNLESALSGLLDLAAALSRDRGPARSRSLETREEPGVYTTMPDRPDGPRLALAPVSVTATDDGGDPPGGRPVPMHELEVAAGGGAVDIDDAPLRGRVWFRREWLDRRGLDPTRCVVIDVRGGSMEPTLADGCSILVARDRTSRRGGRVYVVRTEDGLVAKRAGREDGEWRLVSDAGPPDWPPAPWRGAEVKGEVIWTAAPSLRRPGRFHQTRPQRRQER